MKPLIYLIVIVFIIVANAVSVYPSFESLNQSEERITREDLNTIKWMEMNLDRNTSIIASDHRLERMTEASGFNATKDEAINIWAAENLSEYIDELIGIGKNYSKITHIVLDDIMVNQVVHVGYKREGIHMTNQTWKAAYEKFSKEPFELIYSNETKEFNPISEEPISWTEVYAVNWTYLEKNLYKNVT